jgi:hypothetical protein
MSPLHSHPRAARAALSVALVFTLALVAQVRAARALGLDPALHGLCSDCTGNLTPNEPAFAGLAQSYGLLLSSPVLAPANTIGINAFEMDMSYSLTNFSGDTSVWGAALTNNSKLSNASSTHFTIRKGLPYSFELEGQLGYLLGSELWTIGGAAKWSYHEAMRAFPIDFTARFSGNRLVGSTQLDLSTLGVDFALGTQFGVKGVMNIAPYVAYSPLWIYAGSNTLDATPGKYDAPEILIRNNAEGSYAASTFVFPQRVYTANRVSVGMRFLVGLIKLTPEFAWTPQQYNVNVSLGLQL